MHVASEEVAFSLQLTQKLSPVYSIMIELEKREGIFVWKLDACFLVLETCCEIHFQLTFSDVQEIFI